MVLTKEVNYQVRNPIIRADKLCSCTCWSHTCFALIAVHVCAYHVIFRSKIQRMTSSHHCHEGTISWFLTHMHQFFGSATDQSLCTSQCCLWQLWKGVHWEITISRLGFGRWASLCLFFHVLFSPFFICAYVHDYFPSQFSLLLTGVVCSRILIPFPTSSTSIILNSKKLYSLTSDYFLALSTHYCLCCLLASSTTKCWYCYCHPMNPS